MYSTIDPGLRNILYSLFGTHIRYTHTIDISILTDDTEFVMGNICGRTDTLNIGYD